MHGNDDFRIYQFEQTGNRFHIGMSAGMQGLIGASADEPKQIPISILLLSVSLPHGVDDLSVLVKEFVPQCFKGAYIILWAGIFPGQQDKAILLQFLLCNGSEPQRLFHGIPDLAQLGPSAVRLSQHPYHGMLL